MRKIRIAAVCAILAVSLAVGTFGVFADSYSRYTRVLYRTTGVVSEIIDGDSILVSLSGGQGQALVRLIGCDANRYDKSMDYLAGLLLGNLVTVEPDTEVAAADRWSFAYVYINGEMLNYLLLRNGYAAFNADLQKAAYYYNYLRDAEASARVGRLGMWREGAAQSVYYAGARVNINTASAAGIRQYLSEYVSASVASNIVDYRRTNAFNTVTEIKFVRGVTKEIYDKIYDRIAVSTNLRTAPREELAMLAYCDYNIADTIVNYRTRYGYADLLGLYNARVISQQVYLYNNAFTATVDRSRIDAVIPDGPPLNVNTASYASLQALLPNSAAAIWNIRGLYSLKSFGEFAAAAGIGSYDYALQDNVTFRGADDADSDFININTATVSQMSAAGLSSAQIAAILPRQGSLLHPADLVGLNLTSADSAICLYTNINTASVSALLSLNHGITPAIAADIYNYRLRQVFSPTSDLENYFALIGQRQMYYELAPYITYR